MLAVPLAACASFPTPTPSAPPPPSTVVVASGPGGLSTSTPVRPTEIVPATPTAPLPSPTLTPPALPEESPAERLRSPTPEFRPSRTPAPTFTPAAVEIATPYPRPTMPPHPPRRTPTRAAAAAASAGQKPAPTAIVRAPHFDFAHAQTIPSGSDVPGALLAPGQSNIHRFEIPAREGQVRVTVSGPDVERYRTTLVSPDGDQVGPGTPVGATGRLIKSEIGGQTGSWYVEVALDPKAARPSGPYSIRVDVRAATA